ncbi:DNA helicase PcrA [bacterium]|nr:MAG: DNA helicase PcrA [bacterium]
MTDLKNFLNNLDEKLNINQLDAIKHEDGPALVLAGAGSGKTRVLTIKIASLIKNKKCGTNELLALTFTNKASKEMIFRISKILGSKLDFPWMGTFHSISYKILRMNFELLKGNYNSNFSIYDPTDQLKIIKNIIKINDLDLNKYEPSRIRGKIDSLKNSLLYDEWEFEDDKEEQIIKTYQSKLESLNAMDFGDLILKFYELLTINKNFKERIQKLFKYVFVDEYQDTNIIQFRLINVISSINKNLFAVGDEDQSIYGWRGANIENILQFKKFYPETKIYKLEQNYRSTPQILNVSNLLISNNSERLEKNMWTENVKKENVKLWSFNDDREEAKHIAREIMKNLDLYKYEDIAVFYRTNAQSRVLEEELRKANIKYKIYGNISFYERSEVKDCISFLKFIVNPDDEIAFDRIINLPSRGIGKKTIEKIKNISIQEDQNYYKSFSHIIENNIFSKKIIKSLELLENSIKNFKKNLDEFSSISESFEKFLIDLGYFDYLKDDDKLGNVSEFLNYIAEFELSSDSNDISDFLNSLMLSSSTDEMVDSQSFVTLMTVHLSKGLEFPCVYVVGIEEGLFPHSRSMYSTSEIEEERRLCYVAFTRAISSLNLSYCKMRRMFGSITYASMSQFLDEIIESDDLLEINAISETTSNERVFHYKFGNGFIDTNDNDNFEDVVTVVFDSGIKKKVFVSDLEEIE